MYMEKTSNSPAFVCDEGTTVAERPVLLSEVMFSSCSDREGDNHSSKPTGTILGSWSNLRRENNGREGERRNERKKETEKRENKGEIQDEINVRKQRRRMTRKTNNWNRTSDLWFSDTTRQDS